MQNPKTSVTAHLILRLFVIVSLSSLLVIFFGLRRLCIYTRMKTFLGFMRLVCVQGNLNDRHIVESWIFALQNVKMFQFLLHTHTHNSMSTLMLTYGLQS